MKHPNVVILFLLSICFTILGQGCDNNVENQNEQDRSDWPAAARQGESHQSMIGGSADFAPTTPCQAAADYSSQHFEGIVTNIVGTLTDNKSIRSYVELQGKDDSLWYVVSGGTYGDIGESSGCAMSIRIGQRVLYLGDRNKLNPYHDLPSPAIDELAKIHEDGAIELVYGTIRPEDTEAFMKMVDDDNYVYDETCDLFYLGEEDR